MNHPTGHVLLRRAAERGGADHGWLKTRHTFSFADYYDPAHMGYRSLRVINDDLVAPGAGFPMHPHRDMEIFSYVLAGSLAHEDSMGNRSVLKPGDIQVMRAGSGVRHSEYNSSKTEPVHLLQIWIVPAENGLEPAYSEWKAPEGGSPKGKRLVISSDGREGTAEIAQDADVYRLLLDAGETAEHTVQPGRGLWLHIAEGTAEINGIKTTAGDSLSCEEGSLKISASGKLNALLFDLG